jgi:hypothetical protein
VGQYKLLQSERNAQLMHVMLRNLHRHIFIYASFSALQAIEHLPLCVLPRLDLQTNSDRQVNARAPPPPKRTHTHKNLSHIRTPIYAHTKYITPTHTTPHARTRAPTHPKHAQTHTHTHHIPHTTHPNKQTRTLITFLCRTARKSSLMRGAYDKF